MIATAASWLRCQASAGEEAGRKGVAAVPLVCRGITCEDMTVVATGGSRPSQDEQDGEQQDSAAGDRGDED